MNHECLIFEIPFSEPNWESPCRVRVAGKLYLVTWAIGLGPHW